VEKVELLLKQGKTVDEIEKELKSVLGELEIAKGGLNAILQSFKIAPVKGERAELQLLSMIYEAFLANKNVSVEPLGGPDATDVIVKFLYQDLEIGRVLIESKASERWNNAFLEQIQKDMRRYGIATAILSVLKLPRGAKVKGYTVDDTLGNKLWQKNIESSEDGRMDSFLTIYNTILEQLQMQHVNSSRNLSSHSIISIYD